MRKVRIYTKTGDKGETSLFGGKRVSKDDLRIEAIGTVDELNAALGVSVSFVKDKQIVQVIKQIQNDLFNIGAELANPNKIGREVKQLFHLEEPKILELEKIIDQLDGNLPTLNNFILPGGINSASLFQLSRSIARRSERRLITLSRKEKVNPNLLAYINRLSDLLFIISRHLNHKFKTSENLWLK